MRHLPALLAASFTLALAGCASPPYRPAPDAPLAKLDLKLVGNADVCIDGEYYSLVPDQQGLAPIPGDAVVNLFKFYYFSQDTGTMIYTWSCGPAIAFTSVKDETYLLDGFAGDNACHLEVYRADAAAPAGVALEPSVQGFFCPKQEKPAAPKKKKR